MSMTLENEPEFILNLEFLMSLGLGGVCLALSGKHLGKSTTGKVATM